MRHDEIRDLLGRLTFSANLPPPVLDELAAICSLERYERRDVVFREGSPAEKLYVVVSGRVALDMHVPGRGDVRVVSLGPGDLVGWSAVIGQGRMTTSAAALDATDLLAMDGPELLAACERNPETGYRLMRSVASALSNRLVATRLQLLDLFGER